MDTAALAASLALGLALAASGCAATSCGSAAVCGAATWAGAEGSHVEGHMVVAPAVDMSTPDRPRGALSDRLAVGGAAPSLLRFDASALATRGAVIERAVLSLSPHAAWRPSEARVRLFARGADPAWSSAYAASSSPALASDPAAEASLPPRTREPIRLDVTRAVRAWRAGLATALALTTDGEQVVFQGPGAADVADRPRLEVLLR